MMLKGIKKRWMFNSLGFTVGIFTLLVISFGLVLRGYFHGGIRQALKGRCNEVCSIYRDCCDGVGKNFTDTSLNYVENFSDSNIMAVMIFDESDEIILTSQGFLPDYMQVPQDYWQAKNSAEGFGIWEGRSPLGERLVAVCKCVYDISGKYLGAVRYIVSSETAYARINFGIGVLLLVELLVIIFMIISGMYFIKSIVRPVEEICEKSKLIAQGDFGVKIDKKYDDEIGELGDTINYMAHELRTSEKLKNDFISSISHELRTPLTAIKGWAETMQICNSDTATLNRGLETIVKEAERLSWIVEGMLDFSSIKEKRVNLIKEKIDILAELGEAVYMFKSRAETEKKTLMYTEPKMLPPICGDRNRLRQVFINILDNALKYTSQGGGISVSAGEKNGKIYINVTDNGCGIPTEHLPNVTKKFYKANYLQRGSGIGLAIVDELVALHGGKLSIISEEGFGTTVTVMLPVFEDSAPEENKL